MKTVVVIGGGPAGIMSAITSAQLNNKVILFEKNEKLGKKLFITGKGRCNLTNNSSVDNVINNTVNNGKFLYSALNEFSPSDVISFFENLGLRLKTERGNRVFPESDKSSDVIKYLQKAVISNNVDLRLNTTVLEIVTENRNIVGVKTDKGFTQCDSAIVATGGISYPKTGSTGDGYKFAKKAGHTLIPTKAGLVGIETKNFGYTLNDNLTLKNVSLTAKASEKVLYTELGELMLTNYGISGPLALTCSSLINNRPLNSVCIYVDFKPGLTEEKLNNRIMRDFAEMKNAPIYVALTKLIPSAIVSGVLMQAKINKQKLVSTITVAERDLLVKALKSFRILPTKLRSIDEAIVTAGGVNVKELSSKTMESKFVKGLFFAGEVIDVDALTGGYNIQIALSTGYTAGKNA
jgi:predicted Rossmann fold flavoprotein